MPDFEQLSLSFRNVVKRLPASPFIGFLQNSGRKPVKVTQTALIITFIIEDIKHGYYTGQIARYRTALPG
ncbi:MAG TPA: hypothetical protein PK004_07955, partial [Smithella sp.]|nr:hypothetical protein [Smithella sp.]HQP41372.1 hypothetical protein [Smithella sp.]